MEIVNKNNKRTGTYRVEHVEQALMKLPSAQRLLFNVELFRIMQEPCLKIRIKKDEFYCLPLHRLSHVFVNVRQVCFVSNEAECMLEIKNSSLKSVKQSIAEQGYAHLFIFTNSFIFPIHIFSSILVSGRITPKSIFEIFVSHRIYADRFVVEGVRDQLLLRMGMIV